MAKATQQEISDLWYKFIEEIRKSLNLKYKELYNHRLYNLFTKVIRPADLVENKIHLYENTGSNSQKYFRDFPGASTEKQRLSDVKLMSELFGKLGIENHEFHHETDNSQFFKIKEIERIINTIDENIKQKIHAEYYKSSQRIGLDNIVSIDDDKNKKQIKLIKQSNRLNSAQYNLTLTQKKALAYCIFFLQKNLVPSENTPLKSFVFEITPVQFKKLGVGNNTKQIRENLDKILSAKIVLDAEDESWQAINIFQSFEYTKNKKTYSISFTPAFVGLINQLALHKEYTILNCNTLLDCRSYYATRIYELCAQFRNSKTLTRLIGDKELRKILNCENKHTDISNFRKRCLNIAKRELDELFESGKSDLTFEISPYRKGKFINGDKEILTWFITIKNRPLYFNDTILPREEKETMARNIIEEMTTYWNISPNFLNIFDDQDFETKMKIVRELQFHFISINKNHDLFGQIFMETIPQTLGN